MSDNIEKHLNHPFYKIAAETWLDMQQAQILKGAEKYDEPFNPDSWTSDELVQHALQENVDQLHYIVGLYHRIVKLEKENQELRDELKSRDRD